jgi:hypothetical protein
LAKADACRRAGLAARRKNRPAFPAHKIFREAIVRTPVAIFYPCKKSDSAFLFNAPKFLETPMKQGFTVLAPSLLSPIRCGCCVIWVGNKKPAESAGCAAGFFAEIQGGFTTHAPGVCSANHRAYKEVTMGDRKTKGACV